MGLPRTNLATSKLRPRSGMTARGERILAGLHQPHRFLGTDHAVSATGFSLIEALVGDLEKRVVIGAVARAACNTDANREAVGLTWVRVGNTTTHALTEGHRIFGVDAIGNNNEFLTAKAISKV